MSRTTASAGYFSHSLIAEMQSSIKSLDTPFVSEVRLPIASFWKGRFRVDGFESNLPMEHVMLGLPVAGVLNGSALNGGLLLRSEDDIFGLHLVIRIHRSETDPEDNCGWRGLHRAVHVSRGLLRR